jgi:hypothetical protein
LLPSSDTDEPRQSQWLTVQAPATVPIANVHLLQKHLPGRRNWGHSGSGACHGSTNAAKKLRPSTGIARQHPSVHDDLAQLSEGKMANIGDERMVSTNYDLGQMSYWDA